MVHKSLDPCGREYLWYKGYTNIPKWRREKIMSKKSRRRNRRLLKAAALLGGLALATRGRGNQTSGKETVSDAQKSSQLGTPKKVKTPKRDTVVKTPTTIKDSMPTVGMKKGDTLPKNELSKRVTERGEVYTIKDAKEGKTKKVGNKDTAFVNEDYIYQDGMPYTKGRFGTFKAKQEMDRGMLPPQLRVPGRPNLTNVQGNTRRAIKNFFNLDGIRSEPSFSGLAEGDFAAKDGGRITKKGVKRGAAKRGFGRAYTKGRK